MPGRVPCAAEVRLGPLRSRRDGRGRLHPAGLDREGLQRRRRHWHLLITAIRARLDALSEATRTLPKPSVVCLEWIDPPFPMGNWGPELVELAGGANALGAAGQHSRAVAWEEVRTADPEVLVVAPCGFNVRRTAVEMNALERSEGWADLRAARAGRVFVADGNLYFNRSGPTMFDTPMLLAEMLHPKQFAPRRENVAWRHWPPAA